jgi:hypothetical protein
MHTVTFDTLKFANTLKNAGVDIRQAEAEAQALSEALGSGIDRLATKNDLELLRSSVRADMNNLQVATKADMANLKTQTQASIEGFRSEVKADMANLKTQTQASIEGFRSEVKADMASLRSELKADIADLRAETKADSASLRADIECFKVSTDKKFVDLELRMTLKFGAMLAVAVSILIAVLKVPT